MCDKAWPILNQECLMWIFRMMRMRILFSKLCLIEGKQVGKEKGESGMNGL